MTIELITGNPGAGKTTYAVAERVAKEAERVLDLEVNGQPVVVKRRVLAAGIGGLLVEHEKLPHTLTGDHQSQKVIDYYNAIDEDGEPVHKRLRGDPPVDLPETVSIGGKELHSGPSLFNWWLWCEPGDLIVVDEVQFIVPRGTLGKKPPPYIALLEVHRHFGVDFIFITQHPQLLDTTIRNLVGMHRHVRSVMGSRMCMVYAWDHASNPERFTMATKSQFLRGPKHYALFKSAAAHVKPPTTGRAVLVVVPLLLVAAFVLYRKLSARFQTPAPAPAALAVPAGTLPSPAPSGSAGLFARSGGASAKVVTASDRDWPTYIAEQWRSGREPLDGRALQWEGGYQVGATAVTYFGLYIDNQRVTTLTLADLVRMGYVWTTSGPCVGSLRFGQLERLVTCATKAVAGQQSAALPVAAAPESDNSGLSSRGLGQSPSTGPGLGRQPGV